jgi:integrase
MSKRSKRGFGSIRKLPSGRLQARYTGPDGISYTGRAILNDDDDAKPGEPIRWGGSVTFDSRQYADAYLARVHAAIQAGKWVSPDADAPRAAAPVTLAAYSKTWLAGRDLSESTRLLYSNVLRHILPALGGTPLPAITPAAVRDWHAKLKGETGPTMRAHAYSLLRTIMNTAVADEVIVANPCRVRGAGSSKRVRAIRPASLAELEALAKAMPERYRLMVLLAAWCALRFGELAELRRSDIDVRAGVIHVRRGVIRGAAGEAVKGPKSEAGKRDVNIPPHLMPAVKAHLRDHVAVSKDALVFPAASGGHMAPSALYAVYHPARETAGRPDLRFHDLRHTGAVLAATTGATLAELMARLGHSTVSAALRYQHAAAERDKVIAAALSELAGGTVTPITRARAKASRQPATK